MASIQGIYVALFGRPADPAGLQYFNTATNNGANLNAIGDLAATAEYQDRFKGMDNASIVTAIYQSLFGRNPELAGLTFFVDALNKGTININNVAINILDGAKGDDLATVNNKIEAANAFTAAIDTPDELAAYRGNAAADSGRDFLDDITADKATIPTADQTADAVAHLIGNNPGSNLTLTSAVGEQIVGTGANDIISGVVDAAGTFNVGDVVNGAAGMDTLNLLVTATSTFPAGATVSNVEIINITHAGTSGALNLDTANFAGVQQLWQIDNTNASDDFQDVSVGAGVTVGFRSTGVTATAAAVNSIVTAENGVHNVAVALDGVDTGSTITVAETTAADVSDLSVSGSVAAVNATTAGTLNLDASAATADIDSLHLAMTSNATVVLGPNLDDLNTIDASASTGGLTINLGTPDELTSAKFGSGNDTITVGTASIATAGTLSIDLGAGNDTITFNGVGNAVETATTITLGAGNDTFAVGATLTNVTSAASFAGDLITVADFKADQDVLNLSALGPRDVLVNTELANISGAATLDAAIATAAAATTIGSYSVFNYGGDAYVLNNLGGQGFTDGDGLVKITGLHVEDLNAQNFVA